jgi:hypothetical protein
MEHAGVRNAKEVTQMRHRTALKTGRSAEMQASALRPGSFPRYVAMVDQLSTGYVRPLRLRLLPALRAA